MNTQINLPIRLFSTLILIGILYCSQPTATLAWQDDPFDPFATDETDIQIPANPADDLGPALDESLSDGVVLVINSVRESNPTTPMELARALNTMITIGQYDEAERYLDQLIAARPTGPQLFELSQQLGSPFWLEVRSIAELQPKGSDFAELVIRTAKNEAYAPERIDQLVTELSDDNKFVRQAAFKKLRLLGGPAVSVMLEVCEDRKRRREVPFVASALKQMGTPALFPLIGAARADGTIAQAVAAGALSSIDSPLAIDALLRMSISSQVPESVREIAAEAVSRRGLQSQSEIEDRIYRRANAYLDGRVTIPSDGNGQSKIWNWNFATGKLIATMTSQENAIRIMSVDLARDIYGLRPGNIEYRMLQLLTVLEATKRVLGPNRSVFKNEVTTFIEDLGQQDLETALLQAQKRMLVPAAIGAAEMIGQMSDVSILIRGDGKLSTLVEAVLSGHRQLQFAAVKAIVAIDPKQPYPGCSYVGKYIAMLANSSGNSTAVAVHPKPESAQALATSIFQSGRTGLTANSAVELFEILNTNPDIEFLIITDTFSRPHYQELVQQIRSFWISQHMPIALLIRDDDRERQAKIVLKNDPRTLVMPFTLNAKSAYSQVARLLQILPPSMVSNVQRELQSEFAMEWLAKTLAAPKTYGFYQLSRFRNQISQLVRHPGAYDSKATILANLGTPDAQRILVDLASDIGLPIADRRTMAVAFQHSIEQSGVLLTRQEIRTQYQRHEASFNGAQDSQQVLRLILDAIESKSLEIAGQISAMGK